MKVSIVLVEPENSGNVGAIARVMANFGFKQLVLINPQCKIDREARNRAKHAQRILDQARIKNWDYLKRFDYLIGTTGKNSTNYNLPRVPLTPNQLAERLAKLRKRKLALLLGREGDGLLNEEIRKCDFVVTIPTSLMYVSMNVSHALSVILYELFQKTWKSRVTDAFTPIDRKGKEVLLSLIYEALNKLNFRTPTKLQTQKTVWKRLIGKAFLTKREAYALMGFFRRIH